MTLEIFSNHVINEAGNEKTFMKKKEKKSV
jgi:hypothetical protein